MPRRARWRKPISARLFLDEVGEMPREVQNRFLKVLVEQKFERVHGTKKVKVDVRVLSSTAINLDERIEGGAFRQDLFHRLAVVPVKVPGLEDRREDISELIAAFMARLRCKPAFRRAKSGRMRWRCCNPTAGRVICGSFATTWSG